ncbi:DMT family transporter [Methylobacterium longum]|uniref:DMT family transporter n=1 Tax=Methylobacterium longum TaxID=767694 RepID=A0ABT8AW93_9HYPH|nr:DMT family transporter [Methylobacterium longum]MDN3573942.1 DMT family transporter [Methylobacterium longum]
MALIWGVTWLPTKIAVQTVPPIFLATARFLLSGVLFLVIVRVRRLPLRIPAFGRIAAASLLITTGCYSFVFWGIAHAPSGISAIVNLSLMPIFLAFIGFLYGQERLNARRVGAIGLEPPRDVRRLQLLRDWSHDEAYPTLLPRGPRARGADAQAEVQASAA